MNKIRNIIVALGVFAMMIGSGFAMEIDPPTETVKPAVEIKVVDDVQPPLVGYGYKTSPTQCVLIATGSPGVDCSPLNDGEICTEPISDIDYNLYEMHFDNLSNKWVCGDLLRKPEVN